MNMNSLSDSAWCLDSYAANHITPDLGNLSLNLDYHGPDKLDVGNGTSLKIPYWFLLFVSSPTRFLSLKMSLCSFHHKICT